MQRLVIEPDQRGFKLVSGLGRGVSGADNAAARTIDLVGKAQGDRLAGDGFIEIAILGDDAGDGAGFARRQHADGIAGLD